MNLTLNKQKKKRYIKEMNWKSAWIELKSLRSIGIQGDWDPFQIFKLASMVLNKWKIHGGGDEIWTVLERYIISCLRLGCFQEAWRAIERLQNRFPNSHRVGLLVGMAYEAQGDFDQAQKTYTDHLQRSEAKLVRYFILFYFMVYLP
ncbi:hypothetical protein HMI56_001874 [Coelomomyces lativittatus]|nr:hypothetical protein HMI56_001874 [Coelomomyces lativittatus]